VRVIQTHHRVANAAWIGTILPLRYILLTDLVLDDFSAEEVEDIFAHELGHGHHRHATWYLLLLMTTVLWFNAIMGAAGRLSGWVGPTLVSVFPMFCLMVLIVAFGKFSRLSEHQADWFAARHWAKRWAESAPAGVTVATQADELAHLPREAMVSGAALGAAALRNLADENMLRTDRTSLTHPSIEDRITSLYTLSFSPHMERRLHRHAQIWRGASTCFLVVARAGRVYLYFIK
jgi:Zn-dependent protease with chaperone function